MLPNSFSWLLPSQLVACVNPSIALEAAAALEAFRVGLVVNLYEKADSPELLERLGAQALHLPVSDSNPPTAEQIDVGVAAIADALSRGTVVAVHCAAGLGRTGTLLAAYLVSQGVDPDAAIAQVRAARPGSIETAQQEDAVHEYARRLAAESQRTPAK